MYQNKLVNIILFTALRKRQAQKKKYLLTFINVIPVIQDFIVGKSLEPA